jgi:hypothetical protein
MTRQSYEAWLNAANIVALLLVGLVVVEVTVVLAVGFWQVATQTPLSLESCSRLSAIWPDQDTVADLLTRADGLPRAALCTVGLLQRISCVLALPLGLAWMITYWVIRVSQTGPFVMGDDFIRLFFLAFCLVKFATAPYSALVSGRVSLAMPIVIYLLTSLLQILIIFAFQRRLNELVFSSLRD